MKGCIRLFPITALKDDLAAVLLVPIFLLFLVSLTRNYIYLLRSAVSIVSRLARLFKKQMRNEVTCI